MDRRAFVTGLGAVLTAPLVVEAQQAGKGHRIGLLHVGLDHVPPSLEPLREALRSLGYEEGKTVRLDWRNVADENAAGEFAKTFVRDRVDVIVAFENESVRAARAATAEIPIIMVHVTDPVRDGFVKSLNHPGGNVTGFAGLADLPAKRLELFHEIVPSVRSVLLILDPRDPVTPRQLGEVRRAGNALKLNLVEREASTEAQIDGVFGSLKARDVDGVFVVSPSLYFKFTRLIIRLALDRRWPISWHRRFGAEEGALFSYGGDLSVVGRDAAGYIDKILKGASPADLPVQGLTRFELVINLKTAKALGLTIPPSLLLRADQVIE
jgi:putative tryptophan/tyrosine transport system substrate-binding protein